MNDRDEKNPNMKQDMEPDTVRDEEQIPEKTGEEKPKTGQKRRKKKKRRPPKEGKKTSPAPETEEETLEEEFESDLDDDDLAVSDGADGSADAGYPEDGYEEEYAEDGYADDGYDGYTDDADEEEEGGEKKSRKGWRKALKIFLITIASVLGVVALVYLGGAAFFTSHFYYGTKINGVSFSMKSADDVESYMRSQVEDYVLTIEEKQNVKETITGEAISLEYQDSDEVEKALKAQDPFLWPMAFFKPESADVKVKVSYDREALEKLVSELKCITEVEQTDPVSAYPKFDGEQFVVEPEQTGTKVDQDTLKEKAHEYVSGFRHTLNMEEEACYLLPKYVSDSPEVQAACDTMNNYCKASITYTMGSASEVVDKALISTWLTCDGDMKVTFNTDAVTQYMAEFGKKYDTVGKTRNITTPTGKQAQVSGGTYGWSVDEAAEAQALIASIQNGEVVTREPVYEQTAASHDGSDWGTTYIEVDLTTQHMWYITDGNVAFEADVVTGLPTAKRETPQGVYDILEKLRNKTLRGEKRADGSYEYETPVSYWMRVTYTGIGFHDATWQPWFGGTRYQYAGSHGCINMSFNDAATLYDMIAVGVPVVMHY